MLAAALTVSLKKTGFSLNNAGTVHRGIPVRPRRIWFLLKIFFNLCPVLPDAEGLFLQSKHMEIMNRSLRRPYEAPETEEWEMTLEISILSNEQLYSAEEDDYNEFD